MNVFSGFTILAAFFNLLSMSVNLFWSWKINGMRAHGEMIQYWKAECDKQDNQLKDLDLRLQDMIKRKNEMKMQYHNQVAISKKLEGELQTYRTLRDKLRFDY